MRKTVSIALTIFALFSLVLSGCGPAATPTEAVAEPATAAPATAAPATAAPATDAPATAAPTEAAPPEEPAHEPVTLKYMDYSQERLEFYKQAAVEFNKEYPWITVEPETMVEDDYKQTLPLAFQGESSPDIFVYTWPAAGDYFEMKDLLELGWVAPLDESVLPADFRRASSAPMT